MSRARIRAALGVLVLWAAWLVTTPAAAVYQCGPQTDDCSCGKSNPYPCCYPPEGNGGNCTWWAWEAACCNWGKGLPGWSHAKTWAGEAIANPTLDLISYPVVNSIAVRTIGTYGHVAWVIAVNGSQITVTEQNCCPNCNVGMRQWSYNASYFNGGFIVPAGGVKDCSPGQTQTQGCGNCGQQTRSCGSNGQWGGWSGCGGQGACAPGQGQTEKCGDCGTKSRSCDGGCNWNGWSGCAGPDPNGGNTVCETGLPGVCAEGRLRCAEGWLGCKELVPPSPEKCDALDNDCDDETDEGSPKEMGATPPPFAAALVDVSYPQALEGGERAWVWAVFRNVGQEAWPKGKIWLAALGDQALGEAVPGEPGPGDSAGGESGEKRTSRLAVPGEWPAYDVAAVLDRDVPPGATARFEFPIRASESDGPGTILEAFQLRDVKGALVACPEPGFEVSLLCREPRTQSKAIEGQGAGGASPGGGLVGTVSCAVSLAADPRWLAALWLLALGAALRRRR